MGLLCKKMVLGVKSQQEGWPANKHFAERPGAALLGYTPTFAVIFLALP